MHQLGSFDRLDAADHGARFVNGPPSEVLAQRVRYVNPQSHATPNHEFLAACE